MDLAVRRRIVGWQLVLLCIVAVCRADGLAAQDRAPQFEVASVRPSSGIPVGPVGIQITPRQARFSFLSLLDYIGIATGVRAYQIVGPQWLASSRFDIIATIPDAPAASSQVPMMMRALLADRFRMRTHPESRDLPVYALEVAPNGRLLVPVPPDQATDDQLSITSGFVEGRKVTTLGGGAWLAIGDNRVEARHVTMAMLAETLSHFVDRPVIDETKLDGRYDVVFTLAPEDFQAMMTRSTIAGGFAVAPELRQRLESASPVAIPDALERTGLLMKARRAPIDVLVIDHIEQPSTN